MMSASLAVMAISGLAHAADFNTLTTTTTPSASPYVAAPAQKAVEAPKKQGLLKSGARIVPDTTPSQTPATKNTLKKSDQGYSDMSAYNVVNDQNKPITNDWTRPKSWRIGYKNKDRAPVNE